jgi:hypothetical protein
MTTIKQEGNVTVKPIATTSSSTTASSSSSVIEMKSKIIKLLNDNPNGLPADEIRNQLGDCTAALNDLLKV